MARSACSKAPIPAAPPAFSVISLHLIPSYHSGDRSEPLAPSASPRGLWAPLAQFFPTFSPGGLLAGPSRAVSHLCGAAPTFYVGTPGFPASLHVRILVPRTSPAERPASCPQAGHNSSSEVLLFPQPEAPRRGAPLGVWAPIRPRGPGNAVGTCCMWGDAPWPEERHRALVTLTRLSERQVQPGPAPRAPTPTPYPQASLSPPCNRR